MQVCGFTSDDKLAIRVLVALDALEQMRECLEQLELSRTAQKDYMRGSSREEADKCSLTPKLLNGR